MMIMTMMTRTLSIFMLGITTISAGHDQFVKYHKGGWVDGKPLTHANVKFYELSKFGQVKKVNFLSLSFKVPQDMEEDRLMRTLKGGYFEQFMQFREYIDEEPETNNPVKFVWESNQVEKTAEFVWKEGVEDDKPIPIVISVTNAEYKYGRQYKFEDHRSSAKMGVFKAGDSNEDMLKSILRLESHGKFRSLLIPASVFENILNDMTVEGAAKVRKLMKDGEDECIKKCKNPKTKIGLRGSETLYAPLMRALKYHFVEKQDTDTLLATLRLDEEKFRNYKNKLTHVIKDKMHTKDSVDFVCPQPTAGMGSAGNTISFKNFQRRIEMYKQQGTSKLKGRCISLEADVKKFREVLLDKIYGWCPDIDLKVARWLRRKVESKEFMLR